MRKSNVLLITFIIPFLSFAVVITPNDDFIEPNNKKVDPYLFYKSKDTPPILHNWKKDAICFYDKPKCKRKGI